MLVICVINFDIKCLKVMFVMLGLVVVCDYLSFVLVVFCFNCFVYFCGVVEYMEVEVVIF